MKTSYFVTYGILGYEGVWNTAIDVKITASMKAIDKLAAIRIELAKQENVHINKLFSISKI